MVLVEGVCIDAWEVTLADILPLVGTPVTGNLPPRCSGAPAVVDPRQACGRDSGLAEPAGCITWCEAYFFCQKVGKHLCGHLGGGAVAPADVADAGASEWARVCTGNGARVFATSTTPANPACNITTGTVDDGRGQPHDRAPSCEGPPGVFDMPGNMIEWLDACGVGGDDRQCANGGDSYAFHGTGGVPLGACNVQDHDDIGYGAKDKAFRCCATPR